MDFTCWKKINKFELQRTVNSVGSHVEYCCRRRQHYSHCRAMHIELYVGTCRYMLVMYPNTSGSSVSLNEQSASLLYANDDDDQNDDATSVKAASPRISLPVDMERRCALNKLERA